MKSIKLCGFFTILSLGIFCQLSADAHAQLLTDNNSDGLISVVAIGDSLTSGLGDTLAAGEYVPVLEGTEFGEGYPGRLVRYLGVSVENEGVPGEHLVYEGADRFPGEVQSSRADLAIFFEGLNDALNRTSSGQLSRSVQRLANVSHVLGRELVLVTSPTPCCSRAGRGIFIDAYNQEIKNVAAVNGLTIADIALAWSTTCQNEEECELFNVPEGLHPNKLGYDVIAQTIAAAILGIDVFAADGAVNLAAAIGVAVEDIKVKPLQQVTTPVN